jgi:MoaA/NifB/PqqE/SkfB family radical SAM enzyme
VPYSGVLEKIRRSVDLNVPVAVSSVLTASNFDEMETLVSDCHKVGAYHVQLGFVMDGGRAKDNPELFLSRVNRKDIISRYRRLRKNYPRKYISLSTEVGCSCRSRLGKCLSWLRGRQCAAGKKYAVITPDGRMKPCFHLTDQDYWGRLSKQSLIEHGIGMRGESN